MIRNKLNLLGAYCALLFQIQNTMTFLKFALNLLVVFILSSLILFAICAFFDVELNNFKRSQILSISSLFTCLFMACTHLAITLNVQYKKDNQLESKNNDNE